MSALLLACRLVLAATFLVAGLAKLGDRAGSRQALLAFGVPKAVAPPFAVLLPLGELTVAVALLPAGAARFGALGALLLLLGFVTGIARSMARGEAPDCHCFGQLHSKPAGPKTLIRNGVLAAAAGFVALAGWHDAGPGALSWLDDVSGAQRIALGAWLVLAAGLAGGATFLLQLLRQNGRLLMRVEALESALGGGIAVPDRAPRPKSGLPVGTPAPEFHLAGIHGEMITLESLRSADRPVALLFTDPSCGPCNALLPEISRWQQDRATDLTIALISRGSTADNLTKSSEHGLTNVLLQEDREISEAYLAQGTPTAVIVGPDGRISSPVAGGVDAIRALLASVRPAFPTAVQVPLLAGPTLGIGDPAPDPRATAIRGREVTLSSACDGPTLLLFWNPDCGFCKEMLDQLRAWERDHLPDAPGIVLLSTGGGNANEAMGLRSPILLDGTFAGPMAFGATGTPSAILIDADWRIASHLAVGAGPIEALAEREGFPIADRV